MRLIASPDDGKSFATLSQVGRKGESLFSLYGLYGPIYKGPLEQMNRIRQTRRIAGVPHIDEGGGTAGVEPARSWPQEVAIGAYREMRYVDLERGPLYHATQVMSTPVVTVTASDDVAHAWRMLRDKHVRQAPVLDGDMLVGIVSERDLLTAIDIDGERIIETLQRRVQDVMTTPVVAAAPATDIRDIAAAMLELGVDGVPIAGETGGLIGFVSRSDILRAVVTDPPVSLWR